MLKWAKGHGGSNQVVLEDRGSICHFCPESALQVASKLATIEYGMYMVEKGSKLAFDCPFCWGVPGAGYSK